MSNELGIDRALIYSTVHEFIDEQGKYSNSRETLDEFKMDMYNNWMGATSSKSTDELLKNNELSIIKGENNESN